MIITQFTLSWKIQYLAKKCNFRQKPKFWSKIETFVKNRNFRQKSKLSTKMEIFVKNRNFCRKSKFLSKIEILFKSRNFRPKSAEFTLCWTHWIHLCASASLPAARSCACEDKCWLRIPLKITKNWYAGVGSNAKI